MKGLAIAALFVVVTIAAVVFLGGYGGTPTATSPSLSATPNPQVAQTLQVTLTSQQYSVYPTGATFVYWVYQQASNGSQTALAYNAKVVATLVSQSGFLHTYSATVSVTTTAICSGINCVGVSYNITVKSQLLVSTYTSLYASPVGVSVFSNAATFQKVVPGNAPSIYGSYAIYGLIVAFIGLYALIGAGLGRSVPALVIAIILTAGGFISVVVIQWGFQP